MKQLNILVVLLVIGGVFAVTGIALAQQAGWIAPLTEEYSLVWKSAYDETAKYDMPPAGREVVAHRVLDAHIATRTAPGSGDPVPPQPPQEPIVCTQTIAPNDTVSGQWAVGCDSRESGRGHSRYYSFTLTSEAYVTITLESSDADTYLYLRQGNSRSGNALKENDDVESGNTDSQIADTLAAGTYTIEATTYSAGETGSFFLTISSDVSEPTPARITAADIDGYTSEYRIEIFVSSIGVNLAMTRRNILTVGGTTVRLDSNGNLTTDVFGTVLVDRYSWACNPVNGSTGERSRYASDEHGMGLPRTDLDNSPLFNHSLGRSVSRMCSGDTATPSVTTRTTWTERFRL